MSKNGQSSTTKVALVGAGYIADYHLLAVRDVPGAEVVAICDLDGRRADRFAKANGIAAHYDDLSAMLKSEKLDAVHVLTPPNLHLQPGRTVLEAGVDLLMEKPLAHTFKDCETLQQIAKDHGVALGTSFNFLYSDGYDRLQADVKSGRLGKLDQVDIVWNKTLGQLSGGPFGAWMLQHPRNILFEVAPHSFGHAMHLVGGLDDVTADARDEIALPRGNRFFRRWEILGWRGTTSVRIRFSFIDGYPEHYVHVRGTNGTGICDFERGTYQRQEHGPHLPDVDRYTNVMSSARDSMVQATNLLKNSVLGKAGIINAGGPFEQSIAAAVRSFYATRKSGLDERLSVAVAKGAVAIAERVAAAADLPDPEGVPKIGKPKGAPKPTVLVIGGTGFIGTALVRRLRDAGHGVRVLARDPAGCSPELLAQGVEVARGDFTKIDTVAAALDGIQYVYHLARGFGNSWEEFVKTDVDPTRKLAELCGQHEVKRFFYASSIAIYYAGKKGATIDETTQPVQAMLRANPYARSKVENERQLLELHRTKGLPLVIFRPGVVLGRGGSPYHWGIAEWPYQSVCRLYGDGNNGLPVVLVDDVADAMVAALDAPDIEGQSFNLTTAPVITANDYLDEFERHAGIKLRRVPRSGLESYAGAMMKWAVKSLGSGENLRPSYADWDGRNFASVFDCSKAERELHWTPVKDRDVIVRDGIHAPVDEVFGSG